MTDLTPQERLQPALLDRLRDDEPDKKQELRRQRVISIRELHRCVRRDLAWLLNAGNVTALESLEDYPEVARSVVNYGTPDLSGQTISDADVPTIERSIKQAILNFEPRILPRSLKVVVAVQQDEMSHNRLTLEIRGQLWAHPMPSELYLRTEVDLETGEVYVSDGPT